MARKLASIQRIAGLAPIPEADAIEVATVLGYKAVVKKGEFTVGQKIIYVEVDAQVSPTGPFAFLAGKNVRTSTDGRTDPVLKTLKLRGQISQGLVIPIQPDARFLPEGTDVSELLGVTLWSAPIPASMAGDIEGPFPTLVSKTDEERLQSDPDLFLRYPDLDLVCTLKFDGASTTFYKDDEGREFVCSRNWALKETEDNTPWKLARSLRIFENLPCNHWISAECVGPGLQKNHHKLSGPELRVFTIGDVRGGRFTYEDMVLTCLQWGLTPVTEVARIKGADASLDALKEIADATRLEGIVIRPAGPVLTDPTWGVLSAKVISAKYLLKNPDL